MVVERDLPYAELATEANAAADNDLYGTEGVVPIFHSPPQSEFSDSEPDLRRKFDEFPFLNDEVDGCWSTDALSLENRRQRLLRAIHFRNTQEVSDILDNVQGAAELLHEPEFPESAFSWPITPLSLAILEGNEDVVRLLLHHGKAGTCGIAIKQEVEQLLPAIQDHMFERENDDVGSTESLYIDRKIGQEYEIALLEQQKCVISFLWSDPASAEVTNLRQHFLARHIPPHACLRYRKRWSSLNEAVDPTSLALRSLLFTSGDVEALFGLLRNASLDLRHAQFCDIGRTLWFWAAQKNYTSILRVFLEDGFSINFRATATRFASASASHASEFWRGGFFEAPPINSTALWNGAYAGADKSVIFLLEQGALLQADLFLMERDFLTKLSELAHKHPEGQTDYSLRITSKLPQHSPRWVEIPTSEEGNSTAFLFADSKWLALAVFGGSSDCDGLDELQAMSVGLGYMHLRRQIIGDELLQKKIEQCAITLTPLLMAATLSDLESTKMLLAFHADPCSSLGYEKHHLTDEVKSRSWAAIFRAGTPLLAALRPRNCDVVLVESLLKCGADPQQQGIIAIRRARRSTSYSSNAVPGWHEIPYIEKGEVLNDFLNQIDYDPGSKGDQSAVPWSQVWGWDVYVYDPIQYATLFFTKYTNEDSDKRTWLAVLKILLKYAQQSSKRLSRTCLDNCMRTLCATDLDPNWSKTDIDRGSRQRVAPLDAIDLLLDHGASPLVRGPQGLSLLHAVCSSVCSNKSDQLQINTMIQRLVDIGASVNAVDSWRRTPLHYAVVFCPSAIVTLLECGAAREAADCEMKTSLVYACGGELLSTYSFQPDSLRILLDHHDGKFVWWTEVLLAACHRAGQEPLSRSYRPDIDLEQLIKDIVAMDKDSHLHILSQSTKDGNTALHLAANRDLVEPLKGLCTASPLPWKAFAMQNVRGETPLIKACQFGRGGIERVEIILQAIKTSRSSNWAPHPNYRQLFESKPWDDRQGSYTELIDGESVRRMASKAETETSTEQSDPAPTEGLAQCLNMQDNCGWTALHYAARRGDHGVVQLLVNEELLDPGPSAGCCIPSPLDLAYKSENGRCVTLIEDDITRKRHSVSELKRRLELQNRAKLSNKDDAGTDHRISTALSGVLGIVQRADVRITIRLCSLIWVLWRLAFANNNNNEESEVAA